MSDQLLTVLKFALLAVLYLFFLRVVRAVWAELNEPREARLGTATGPPVGMASPPTIVTAAPVPRPPAPAPKTPLPQPAPVATAAPLAALHLTVVDPPDAKGHTYPIGRDGQSEVTVGRAAGCGLALADDSFVSQLHARIFRAGDVWQVEDLGSTNGTFLNRRKVSGPQTLHPGDRLQVGRTVLEVGQ